MVLKNFITVFTAFLVLLFIASSVSAYTSYSYHQVPAGYGFYYSGDHYGVYYGTYYDAGYYVSYYPDSYYNGYYDLVYYNDYYYYPTLDIYYYPGFIVPDGYYPYPDYIVPDGYYPYPPTYVDGYYPYPPTYVDGYYPYPETVYLGGYEVILPYFEYLEYFIPYGYGSYNYPYYYSGYYPYSYPSDYHSGFEGDAGYVTVEKNSKSNQATPTQSNSDDSFKYTFVEKPQYYGFSAVESDQETETTENDSSSNSGYVIPRASDTQSIESENLDSEDESQENQALVLAPVNFNSSCASIQILTQAVTLKTGQENIVKVELKNTALEAFNVSRFNAYADSTLIEVYEIGFDKRIAAGALGELTLRVFAGPQASNSKIFVQVYGSFDSGKSCGFNEIKESFTAYVVKGAESRAGCSAFTLEVPSKLSAEDSRFTITVDNPTNKKALIVLEGHGVSLNPEKIEVAQQTFAEKIVFFEEAGQAQNIRFKVLMEGCQIPSKITYFTSTDGSVQLMSYSGQVKLNENNKVSLTLKNKSSETKTVTVHLKDLPPGFSASDLTLALNPFETRSVSLPVSYAAEDASVEFEAKLSLSFAGSEIEKGIPVSLNADKVSMKAEAQEMVNGSYSLKVSLTNNTEEKMDGKIELASSGFIIQGQNALSLAAKESKEVSLVITPDKPVKQLTFLPVKFVQANGQTHLAYASISPLKGSIATAFVSLAGSATTFGLFIVLLILVVFIVKENELHLKFTGLMPRVKEFFSAKAKEKRALRKKLNAALEEMDTEENFDEENYFY